MLEPDDCFILYVGAGGGGGEGAFSVDPSYIGMQPAHSSLGAQHGL